jgi:hypothetical protein
MHVGISSAVCTCMGCIRSRDPDDPYPAHAKQADAPTGGAVLEDLAARTARINDSWTAAIEQFGGDA